jgi:hypothetical protein
MALERFRLWWLEQRLRLHLGKYNAYLNRVLDQNALSDRMRRLSIAQQLIREPELEFGQRILEAARLKNRLKAIRIPERAMDASVEGDSAADVRRKQIG